MNHAMIITYPGKVFEPSDFMPAEDVPKRPFLADIRARVSACSEAIDVEILGIVNAQNRKEIGAFLKHSVENELKPLLRTTYLNIVRRGLEGDAFEAEGA